MTSRTFLNSKREICGLGRRQNEDWAPSIGFEGRQASPSRGTLEWEAVPSLSPLNPRFRIGSSGYLIMGHHSKTKHHGSCNCPPMFPPVFPAPEGEEMCNWADLLE